MLPTHYLKVTMIVPPEQMDVVDSATFALAAVRAQRLDEGDFMACWDLGAMAHESEDGAHFRVPLFAQIEAPGLTDASNLKLTARIPEGSDINFDVESEVDSLYDDGSCDYVVIDRNKVASQCRFEDVELIDLYAKGANSP